MKQNTEKRNELPCMHIQVEVESVQALETEMHGYKVSQSFTCGGDTNAAEAALRIIEESAVGFLNNAGYGQGGGTGVS
jgi:hypothetical protein